LPVWDKDSYTDKFLVLLPCMCITTHIGSSLQSSLLLPGPLPIVASASLKLLCLLIYSEHIENIQVLGFLLFSNSLPCTFSPKYVTHVQ
jgi:hypothetical protein